MNHYQANFPIEIELALFLFHRNFIVFDCEDFAKISHSFNADITLIEEMLGALIIFNYLEIDHDGWYFLNCEKLKIEHINKEKLNEDT